MTLSDCNTFKTFKAQKIIDLLCSPATENRFCHKICILVPSFSKYQAFGTIGYRTAFYQFLSNLVFRMNAPALVLIIGSIGTGFKEYWSQFSSLIAKQRGKEAVKIMTTPSQGWLVTKIGGEKRTKLRFECKKSAVNAIYCTNSGYSTLLSSDN